MEDSLARMSLLQELKGVWKESEARLFLRFFELQKPSDLPSYSLKTYRILGQKEQSEFAKNWPKEGMIVDGVVYPLVMWERGIKGKGGGYWLTPTVVGVSHRSQEGIEKKRMKQLRSGRTTTPPGSLAEQVQYGYPIKSIWPTPTVQDFKKRGPKSKQTVLSNQCLWPTPSAKEAGEMGWMEDCIPNKRLYNPKTGKHTQTTLNRAVKYWPTPCTRDVTMPSNKFMAYSLSREVKRFPTPNARDCTRDTSIKRDRLPDIVGSNKVTGQLNPMWVEWLQGYPIGWTELKHSATV
jgi:DNA (cytosine-5)-methyltransferase 1